jgi:uncharacterized membrane protein SpoIIM required for sporulation
MVATELTSQPRAWPRMRAPLLISTLLVAGCTTAGAVLAVVDPALAGRTHPHPALVGTPGEAVSIFVNNMRVLMAPFALWALGFPASVVTRRVGDLLVLGLAGTNTLVLGVELGRWQWELIPYVAQLPLEWAALTIAITAWLVARTTDSTRREILVFGAVVVALLTSAAAVETWCTPHLRRTAGRGYGAGSMPSRLRGTVVASRRDSAATKAKSLQGRQRLSSPHRRSVPLGRLVAADRAHNNNRPH